MNPNTFLYAVLGVAIGILAVWILSSRYRSNARVESSNIVELARKEASIDRRHQIAEASLEIKQERQELAQDIKRLRAELSERERDLSAKELTANAMACDLENRLLKLSLQEEELSNREKLVLDTSSGYRTKLEEIAQLNPEDIRNRLEDEVRQECEDDLRDMRQRLFSQSDLEIQREAQRIILTAMQRIACTPDSSNAASTVVLPNDEMKGRIIGKEGRNIKAFEALTGVTLMIDEVPGSVLISWPV
jgi:ribonucrease Y